MDLRAADPDGDVVGDAEIFPYFNRPNINRPHMIDNEPGADRCRFDIHMMEEFHQSVQNGMQDPEGQPDNDVLSFEATRELAEPINSHAMKPMVADKELELCRKRDPP